MTQSLTDAIETAIDALEDAKDAFRHLPDKRFPFDLEHALVLLKSAHSAARAESYRAHLTP